ncbi:cytochrome c maturation protein CcmE domain-containing protein [Dinghuibacter silviterrae]|uniref:Cytochrome c-type biogenesis protein CcmE n=1 Tax=Dinghuibacter silviterrae TaxID=1539049 RepID=A0A4R8DVB5_9BACT|nr:cytochrome c maturation protein CcmE [Dinghuibacter silviterrae]TDX01131.1 cytochrome c-type biogenesis protein CcmE [Dinghuibacter silviterrae]
MKKVHIILLIVIAAAIGVLISMTGDLSTYDTLASARQKQGKFVHVIAKLDRTQPIVYDALKDPNYLSFFVVDSLGDRTQVIYHEPKPADLESSDRLVIKGRMNGQVFDCKDILLKCPSKYKDDKHQVQQQLNAKL